MKDRRDGLLGLAILLLALLPRVWDLDAFISWDEPKWASRSANFLYALQRGKLEGTFQTGHPGVTTMWLGATGLAMTCHRSPEACGDLPPTGSPSDEGEIGQEARNRLLQILPAARLLVGIVIALGIVVIYFLAREIWGRTVALIGAGWIAMDPFCIAHSRLLHLDGLATTFMTLSLLALALYLMRRRGWPLLAASGGLAGMAFLTKASSLFLIPFVASLLALVAWRENEGWAQRVRALAVSSAVWGGAAWVIFVALWPAMWIAPLGTIQAVLEQAIGYAQSPHYVPHFFLGQVRGDPGPWFYPVVLLFRMTPLTMLGLAAAIPLLLRREAEEQMDRGDSSLSPPLPFSPTSLLVVLLLYALLFGAFMTLGAKKFDRYLLPVFPALDLVAAAGLFEVVKVLSGQVGKWASGQESLTPCFPDSLFFCFLVPLFLCLLQLAIALPHHPYYLTWYNPLLGGGRQAQKSLLVGWGEGLDRAANYFNTKPHAQDLEVAVGGKYSFKPFFVGSTRIMSSFRPHQTDYLVFYVNEVQRHLDEDLLQHTVFNPQVQPEHIVSLQGIDYAWIYPNATHTQPMSYIEERDQPSQDILLVNGDSLFAEHYQGELPLQKLYTHWGLQEMAELLDSLPPDRHRIWYARYPDADPKVALDLLEKRGILLEKRAFPYLEVYLFRLLEPGAARYPVDLSFGDQLRLRRFGLTDPALVEGQDGGVVLEWEALRPLEEDYTAFLHLRDAQGRLIAQNDRLITDERLRPASQWEPGTPRLALYHLRIPPETPTGFYDLYVGVYLLATGERLPLLGPNGSSQGTATQFKVQVGSPPYP
jgi:hypothetical protein